jgi:uncharacterized protein YndB with AHSA1/START domain
MVRTVSQERTIHARPEQVFEALASAAGLREWMCDSARMEPGPGGRYEVRWRSGYEARGKVIALEVPRRVTLTWLGTDEPGPTEVAFELTPVEGGTQVIVTHTGFGGGAEWDHAVSESEDGWAAGLENLASVLETGIDLREARRPMLGINFEPVDPQRAAREGLAVGRGIYIEGVAEGSGAQAAGLQPGDILLSLGGREVYDVDSLIAALRAHRAGDRVEAGYVRGPERRAVQVELKARPQTEVPDHPAALAQALKARYDEAMAPLTALLAGVDDETAGRRPAPDEWSVKETLAHLSISERGLPIGFGYVIMGEDVQISGNPDIVPEKIAAVVNVTPTSSGLVERLQQDQAETVAFLAALRPEVVERKVRYRRIAQEAFGLVDHVEEHTAQIRKTLETARS